MNARGSIVHWLRALVRNLLRGNARDAELRADVDSYVDLLADEKLAAGMTPEVARRQALLEFGSREAVKENVRSVRAGALLAQFAQDTRYALRILRRDRAFSVAAVLTLALGIGANTAIFSVVNGVLLHPLSYPDPDRLVVVWERNTAVGKERDPVAALNFIDWQAQSTSFEDLGAWRFSGFTLSNVDQPEQLRAVAASRGVFRALRANPLIGRTFTEDEVRERAQVVVLAHEFWQRRFGGDRAIVGRSLTLNGANYAVVGVMPPDFRFPDDNPVDVYAPLLFTRDDLQSRQRHVLSVIGRLRSNATPTSAQGDLNTIARRIAAQDQVSNPDITIAGAHDVLVEEVRLGLLILLGTVAFVLLIACANVANLLLVRAAARRREIVIRAALGARSGRLFGQLLTESVLLSGVGAVAGLALAWSLLQALVRFAPPDLPRVDQVTIDATVLLFVTIVSLLTGITFGIVPALRASKPRLSEAATQSDSRTTIRFARNRGRSVFLVAEIALSLVLLAAAGLMVRSLINLRALDLGFRPENVYTARLVLPGTRYPVDNTQFRPVTAASAATPDSKPYVFFTQLEERLRALPGVQSVGAVSALPLDPAGSDYDLPVIVEGKPRPRPGEEPQSDFRIATTGYFRTMGIALIRGREFTEFDGPNSTPVIIINDTMARRMFPGEDPIGRRLFLYGRLREIVGVVRSVRHRGFSGEPRPEMVAPSRQFQLLTMTVAIRSTTDPAALRAAVAGSVRALDPALPIVRPRPMTDFLADSVAQPRFTTWLLGAFAVLALLLALVGVYGVMSYSVAQRLREIGVRLALGASRREIVGMVVGQGMTLAAAGVFIGLAGAAAGTRLMARLLFGVTTTDPAAFIAAGLTLGLASLAATYLPARRAARVAPAAILRSE